MQTKHCPKCGEHKSLTEFNKNKSAKDGHQSTCRQCQKDWQKSNPEACARRSKKWNSKNQAKMAETQKAYKQRNPEKVVEAQAKWAFENKDVVNANVAKRRAAKLQATPPWMTKDDFESIRQFYKIANELTELNNIPHQVDHIIPLIGETVCGLHVPWNLQVLTKEANLIKSNRIVLPEEMKWA